MRGSSTKCSSVGASLEQQLPEGAPATARLTTQGNLPHPVGASQAFGYVSRSEREHRRYAHDVAVTFRVGTKVFEGRTRNVSRGGLCATTADALTTGTDLDLDIVLVFDDGMQSEALERAAEQARDMQPEGKR